MERADQRHCFTGMGIRQGSDPENPGGCEERLRKLTSIPVSPCSTACRTMSRVLPLCRRPSCNFQRSSQCLQTRQTSLCLMEVAAMPRSVFTPMRAPSRRILNAYYISSLTSTLRGPLLYGKPVDSVHGSPPLYPLRSRPFPHQQ